MIRKIGTVYKNIAIAAADLTKFLPISSAMRPVVFSTIFIISDLIFFIRIAWVIMHKFMP